MTTTEWIRDFQKAHNHCFSIILHGNVRDQILYHGTYQSIHNVLNAYAQDMGFDRSSL